MEIEDLREDEWKSILFPYLSLIEEIGREVHDYYHRTEPEKKKIVVKKNNYGAFTCKS